MKIAVVEKTQIGFRDPYSEFFDFEYDRFQLTSSNKSKILKKDITLKETFDDYDYVILIGKEPCKHIGKIGNVVKYSGHLVENKYLPLVNPVAAKFNPGLKDTIESAINKIHEHIKGKHVNTLGKYKGIQTKIEAKNYLKRIYSLATPIVLDIETSSLYPRNGYILGIAISHKAGEGVYIDSDCIDDEIERLLQKIFDKCLIIFHNAKFDMAWLEYHFGFRFPNWRDTMLEHYLLNENEPHDLKYLAMKYTGMGEYDLELEDFKKAYCRSHKIRQADFTYDLIPFDTMYKYAGADADATYRLYNKFSPIIDKHFSKLYKDIMIRGTEFLKHIEDNGVPFSRDRLNRANTKYSNDIFELIDKLYTYPEIKEIEKELNVKFNPNSTAQLRKLFFEKLNFQVIKKTPKGEASTDKEVLDQLAELHDIPKIIKEIRQRTKIKNTYITKVLAGLDMDSRLRTGFHLHTVTSGRLSSSGKLNMQQLPRDDKTVKSCIVSTEPDWVIFSQDLKTAEMYYAAALSGDKNLAKVFIEGGDFHSSIAKMTFGLTCPVEEVAHKYGDLRQASKAISFGILYGAGPGKVAQTANITYKEAKAIIDRYFGQFSKLKQWLDATQAQIMSNGYIYSAFGRKRRVPNVFSLDDYEQGHALRSAMNFTVQSVASDVNLLGGMDAAEEFCRWGRAPRIFGLVHDSILGECHKDDIKDVQDTLKMFTQKDRGIIIPGCPIEVDFGYGKSYAEAG